MRRVVLSVVAGLLVTSCGAQTEEERVVERVKAAQQARLDKDGEAFCEFYTGRMRRELGSHDGDPRGEELCRCRAACARH